MFIVRSVVLFLSQFTRLGIFSVIIGERVRFDPIIISKHLITSFKLQKKDFNWKMLLKARN